MKKSLAYMFDRCTHSCVKKNSRKYEETSFSGSCTYIFPSSADNRKSITANAIRFTANDQRVKSTKINHSLHGNIAQHHRNCKFICLLSDVTA